MKRLPFLLLLLLVEFSASNVFSQNSRLASIPSRELHGGIEINLRGAQAIGLRISGEEENFNVSILYTELILSPLATNEGKFTPESIREMATAAQKHVRRMQQDYRIPPEQIYITITPSVIAANVAELVSEIRTRTARTVTPLDVETTVQLGISGSIPRRYKLNNRWYENRNISMLVEVMGNKVQGGYQVNRLSEFGGGGTYDFVTFEVPKGSLGLAAEASKLVGDKADRATFARTTSSLTEKFIRAPLRAEAQRKLGLSTRKKVYLAGPIMRIMSATILLDDTRTYVPVTTNDINSLYNQLVNDPEALLTPDLTRIKSEETRQLVQNGLQAARIAFTTKELIAAAEILRALVSELELQNKKIYFPRYHHLSHILSFVRLQPEEAR